MAHVSTYKKGLPNVEAGMPLSQGLFLELLNVLVEQGIITDEQALARYKAGRGKYYE